MQYISTAETAVRWNVSQRRVVRLAKDGRIPGASFVAHNWMIPEEAIKPMDRRTKLAMTSLSNQYFRFPLFVNRPEDSYLPPLSKEESLLCKAQIAFFACDFEKSYQIFSGLADTVENIYIKIASLFFMCVLPAFYQSDNNWKKYYLQFTMCFEEEFHHKKEMEVFLSWLDIFYCKFYSVPEKFMFDKEYEYHNSVWGLNAYVLFFCFPKDINVLSCLDSYEMTCRSLEKDGFYYEALELRLIMFGMYYLNLDEKSMMYSLKKAMKIAKERNLVFPVANYAPYYADVFNAVLKDYPQEFADEVMSKGDAIFKQFASFMEENEFTNFYSVLSKKDCDLLRYAMLNYPYKEVAALMHLSERTIAVKYSALFEKFNVKNKNDLRERYLQVLGEKQLKKDVGKK